MSRPAPPSRPLKGIRILSLCLNLPGPAALMRCRAMGATCVKLEPPPREPAQGSIQKARSGDPMQAYCATAYEALHEGVRCIAADLKTQAGQKRLQLEMAKADVLLTSFRPSALRKLGLSWQTLHANYPSLTQVAIVGAPGPRAEEPGHDLTYLAENDLVQGLELPPSLYADMAGSLLVSEAVLQSVLTKQRQLVNGNTPRGVYMEIALSEAARYLALPRQWGLTQPGADVGGAHAGYRVYPCRDGRVALAALEPHFAAVLCAVAGVDLPPGQKPGTALMRAPRTHALIAQWLGKRTCAQLDRLAQEQDLPLHTLPEL